MPVDCDRSYVVNVFVFGKRGAEQINALHRALQENEISPIQNGEGEKTKQKNSMWWLVFILRWTATNASVYEETVKSQDQQTEGTDKSVSSLNVVSRVVMW